MVNMLNMRIWCWQIKVFFFEKKAKKLKTGCHGNGFWQKYYQQNEFKMAVDLRGSITFITRGRILILGQEFKAYLMKKEQKNKQKQLLFSF